MSVISRDRVKLRNAMFNIHMATHGVIGCSVFSFYSVSFFVCFLSPAKTSQMNEPSTIFPRKRCYPCFVPKWSCFDAAKPVIRISSKQGPRYIHHVLNIVVSALKYCPHALKHFVIVFRSLQIKLFWSI